MTEHATLSSRTRPSPVVDLTDQDFGPYLDGHPFAVVTFWSPSSAPARAFVDTFEAAAARHPDALFVKVDAQRQRATAAQFNVRSLPTLLVIRENIVVHAASGVLPPAKLDEALRVAQALDMAQIRRRVAGAPGAPVAEAVDRSVETLLRPSVCAALMDAGPRLAAGGLVAIRDAFEPDFAEQMHRSLDRFAAWRVHENYAERFSYHHHNIYHPEEFPAELAGCTKVFDSPASKAWATRLSGRTCLGPTSVSASWYLPGDHSLPHTDNVTTGSHFIRQLAFIWHLAKDWRSEWGGALYWSRKAAYLPSAFNTLYLFNVGPESTHFVTQVSPYAQGKRLTINGWFTGPAPTGDRAWPGPDRIGAGDAEIMIY